MEVEEQEKIKHHVAKYKSKYLYITGNMPIYQEANI